MSLWWRHNIYLWRHNGARRHARAKHYEYFMLENCTQTTGVYWSNNPFELLYIYTRWNNLILNRAIFFKFWNISKISIFILSIGTSLFEVLPLWTASPIISKIVRFFHSFVDSCIRTICHHKDFTVRVHLWENFISPGNTQKYFFWQGTDPQMGPICSEWYSQSDRRKILEPPWSVLDT